MKVRYGFVSNSSSTSFCAQGMWFNIYEHDTFAGLPTKDDTKKYHEIYDAIQYKVIEIIEGTDLCYAIGSESLAIGLSYEDIGDNETGAEFKQRAKDEFDKVKDQLEITPKIEFINEEIHSG